MEKIKVVEYISPYLVLRKNADMLFDRIELLRSNEVVIDFSGVEIISRAFADQYKKRKNKSSKIIREENILENVKKIFEVVDNQHEPLKLKFESVGTIQ